MALRILHIVQSVNPTSGGPIEGIRQIATADHAYGHSREIASLDYCDAPFLSFPGVPVFPQRTAFLDRWFPLTLFRWLKCNHGNYDVVIINGIWGFHLLAAYLAVRNTSTPFLVFTHGMLDPWFRFRYPLKHLKKWLVWPWAVALPLRYADAVCFTCEQEKLLARESFWFYDCIEQVVAYGTQGIPEPARDYAPCFLQQHPAIAGRQCLLFLGRVAPKKAPDLLFRAVAVLQREGLWNPARHCLVMAGPAEGSYARKLLRLADHLGISACLHWTGMLQGDQKWGAFQAASAFVLPSHQENFGIAVAEALSSSIPVLLTHPVNIASEIAADQAGLVETDTLVGVTSLLRRWFATPEANRALMAGHARRCFEQRYQIQGASISITRAIQIAILERKLASLFPPPPRDELAEHAG